ncbi:MAG: T9SS type A sorting domain-containing protein [Flavobacteriales bacterium]|nr:T9SS type A sorting domain-containing protein [Flavobacteriales bacterium]
MRTLPAVLSFFLLLPIQAQVLNGSFENGINGWNVYCPCQPYQLTGNASPGGGQYAVEVGILDFNCPCTIVETIYQPASWLQPGTWVLSAWIRNADPGNVPGAAVRLSEGPAFNSTILADAWSDAGVWTLVADTFIVTGSTDINSLQLSLIPDDGNQMAAGLFGAFDQVQIQQLIGTSIEDQVDVPVELFPNPAIDKLWIDLPETPRSLQLFDSQGRSVPVPQMVFNASRLEMDVEGLCSGPYVLRVATSKDLSTLRFVKQ